MYCDIIGVVGLLVARMMCRLTPPLCLNFLGLIHLDSHITQQTDIEETCFTKVLASYNVAVTNM